MRCSLVISDCLSSFSSCPSLLGMDLEVPGLSSHCRQIASVTSPSLPCIPPQCNYHLTNKSNEWVQRSGQLHLAASLSAGVGRMGNWDNGAAAAPSTPSEACWWVFSSVAVAYRDGTGNQLKEGRAMAPSWSPRCAIFVIAVIPQSPQRGDSQILLGKDSNCSMLFSSPHPNPSPLLSDIILSEWCPSCHLCCPTIQLLGWAYRPATPTWQIVTPGCMEDSRAGRQQHT